MKYSLNLLKSPEDKRDYIFKSVDEVPKTFDMRNCIKEVRDQGTQGSCFAFATAAMKEYQENKDYNFEGYMSPQFFYDNRSNLYDKDKTNDEGMYGRDVMKLLKTIGICTEDEYKYGLEYSKTKDKIPKSIYDSAIKHICKGYASIETIEQLKYALYKNGPCLICFPVYNYGKYMWKKEYKGQKFLGGHAMCVVGYTKSAFIIRNSWGNKWEDNGYCYYPFSHWGHHWEIWTTIDNETEIEKDSTDLESNILDFNSNDEIPDLNDDDEIPDLNDDDEIPDLNDDDEIPDLDGDNKLEDINENNSSLTLSIFTAVIASVILGLLVSNP